MLKLTKAKKWKKREKFWLEMTTDDYLLSRLDELSDLKARTEK